MVLCLFEADMSPGPFGQRARFACSLKADAVLLGSKFALHPSNKYNRVVGGEIVPASLCQTRVRIGIVKQVSG